MTNNLANKQMYKKVALISFVIAILANTYFVYALTDIFKIMSNDTSATKFTLDPSLATVLTTISAVAMFVALIYFAGYISKVKKVNYHLISFAFAIFFVILSWSLSQIWIPLGLAGLLVAVLVVIFRILKRPRQTINTK